MGARRAVKHAADEAERGDARERVHAAKVALGERGPPWWDDGAPDYSQRAPKNTPYAAWWDEVCRTKNGAVRSEA